MKRSVWVTGASGFSGQHMLTWLADHQPDADVIPISRRAAGSAAHTPLDLTDLDATTALARATRPGQVYHLAGAMPPATGDAMWLAFVQATYTLLRALHDAGCGDTRVLLVGSAAEYMPNDGSALAESAAVGGLSPYGMAKSAQTLLALKTAAMYGMELVVARTFNLIGPGMSRSFVLGEICAQLAAGTKTLKLGNIESQRDFLDIRDAVDAYGQLMASSVSLEVFNVCSGEATSIRTMIELAIAADGATPEIISESSRHRANDFDRVIGDPHKITTQTGWRPVVTLEESVRDVIAAFR
ncbi:MAG: GDP-mannose 4,6-dehydratase [Pseudomonadota bacterium]